MTVKTNARQQLIDFVLGHGWELDPTRKAWNRRDLRSFDRQLVQHPTAFRRPAHDGLFWSLELDYTVKSNYAKMDGTRLSRIILKLVDAEGKLQQIGNKSYNTSVEIDPIFSDSYRTLNAQVWMVTYGIHDNATLKQRAELVAADPALVIWLAVERGIRREQEVAAKRRRVQQEHEARKRPLAITVGENDFRTLVLTLDKAVGVLRRADGLTDLPQAVADVEAATAALRAVLAHQEAVI